MSSKTMINDMTHGSVTRHLITFALPIALANLLQVIYNLVDMVVIGQFVGSAGLSAVSIGGDMMNLCLHVGIGFTGAGQVIISQFVGQKDERAISRTVGTLFSFISLLAIAATAVTVLGVDWLLGVMNTPPEAYEQAKDYSLVCFWGMFFIFGYNTVSSILRGMGDSRRPLLFIAIAACVNLVLDLVFVAGLGLDAFGAALATVIGQAVSFVISLAYLYKKRDTFGFDFKPASFAIDRTKLVPIVKLGFPLALQHAAITVSMLFVNSYVNSFGVIASAVTGVGTKLRNVMSIITNSIGTACSAMVGQNMGAGKPERVKKLVWVALAVDMVAFVIMAAVYLGFPEAVFGLFNSDPEVLAWASRYMVTCVLAILTFALMSPFNAVINGIGYASLGFVIGMLDGVVARIGLSLLMGITFGMGIEGFWYGNALAGFATVIPAAIYFFSGRWQKRKLIVEK